MTALRGCAAKLAVVCLLSGGQALAQSHWFNPANGHYYRFESQVLTWEQARMAAMQQSFAGVSGHLATITSAEEQAFLTATPLLFQKYWLGGFQPPGSPEPDGNWQWITGEPFTYNNWPTPFEPNNRDGVEHLLEMFPGGFWNDVGTLEPFSTPTNPQLTERAYIVEFSVPEPARVFLVACVALTMGLIRRKRRA